MATRFAIEAIFKGIDNFSVPVAKMTTRLDRFARGVRKGMRGIQKSTMRVARGMRRASLTIGSLAFLGGYALKGLIGPATRFQHAMDGVNAVVLGAYDEHMPALRKKALELGNSTTFTAVQVANAMEVLAKSGLKAGETMALIEPTLKGAEAAGSDISTMADILVSTIAQMKSLTANDATSVIDAYAVAASSANTTLEELGEGMKKVIPVGETLNFKFKDLLATTTLLQHMGIEASMSASQQRTFFTRLASLTPKAAASFKGLDIDILAGDGSGNIKKLPDLLKEIARGFDRVKGNRDKLAKMAEAVGLRGGIAGNLLIRNMDQLDYILTRISTMPEGAADKMAGMRLDNLYGDLVRLQSAWETFRVQMVGGENMKGLDPLRKLVQELTSLLQDPDNIAAAAKKWEMALLGLQGFWSANKQDIKDIASLTYKTVAILWEVVKMVKNVGGAISDYLIPDFLKPGNWFGTKLTPEQEYDVRYFEAYGRLPASTPAEGAPLAEGMLNGVIRIETAPGVTATVEQPKGAPIKLEPSGNDVGSGYFIPGVGFARP